MTGDPLGVRAAIDTRDSRRNGTAGPILLAQLASEVVVEPPVWLWRCWLVKGAVELLVGRQGCGKTTFSAWLVAQLTTGRPWPGESDRRPPLRCAVLSFEESDERLAARLQASGADLGAVVLLGDVVDHDDDGRLWRRPWRLPGDCLALEAAIVDAGLAVVVIDGLGYAVAGDTHNYGVIGSALSALAGVAERTGCTILGLTHPPKGASDAVTAAIGSTAWTAVARISWVMGADPGDDSGARRVVRPAPGSNYRLPDHGLSFVIGNDETTEAGFVTGLAPSDVDPQQITSPPVPDPPDERSRLDEARDFVSRVMADNGGQVRAAEATAAAKAGGITERTLQRARDAEGVVTRQRGTVAKPDWWWESTASPPSRHGPSDGAGGDMGDMDAEQPFLAVDPPPPLAIPPRRDGRGDGTTRGAP